MTMNEEALIERLIVEAAKRGAVELQLDRAVKAGEEAAKALAHEQMVAINIAQDRDEAMKRVVKAADIIESLQTDLRNIRTTYDDAIAALRELFQAVRVPGKLTKVNRGDLRKAMNGAADILEAYVPF
jgi:hypothetical protein